MFRRLWRYATPVAAIALLGTASVVRANTIQVSNVTDLLGAFVFDAQETAASGNTVEVTTGDFFTIYDFAGFIPGTNVQPADWTFSTLNVGPNAISTTPQTGDSASIPNLTWTYNGLLPIVVSNPPGSSTDLGDFGANSKYTDVTLGSYTSQDHRLISGSYTATGNSDRVEVAAVPLPATANMGLAAFAGMGGLGLWRKWKVSKEVLA